MAHGIAVVLSHQALGDGGALAGGDAQTTGIRDGLLVERAGWVDRQPVVGGAVVSNRVEALQRQPERVHEGVTRRARAALRCSSSLWRFVIGVFVG